MKIYRQSGDIANYTNSTGSTIAAGTGIIINERVAFAIDDIEDGEVGAVRVRGVVETAKPSAEDIGQFVTLNWDATAQEFQLAAGDLAACGVAHEPAGAGATTVLVDINSKL